MRILSNVKYQAKCLKLEDILFTSLTKLGLEVKSFRHMMFLSQISTSKVITCLRGKFGINLLSSLFLNFEIFEISKFKKMNKVNFPKISRINM